jgi:beta-glucanase (GH16 family)
MLSVKLLTFLTVIYSYSIQVYAHYYLIWSDEFDGDSLDTTYWTAQVSNQKGNSNQMLQYYTDRTKNVNVQDGYLQITAYAEAYSGEYGTANYTSGFVTTQYKQDFICGRFETRMKLVSAVGLWPSFAMDPTYSIYGTFARSGVIVILTNTGTQCNTSFTGIYYGDYGPNDKYNGVEFTVPGLATDFHTYAVEWEPNYMRFYIDDINFFNVSNWYSVGHDYPAPFNTYFALRFNLAVGGYFPGNPTSNSEFPVTMYIDYVRAYQNTTHNNTSDDNNSSAFGETQIIEVVVVVVIVSFTLIALFYFYRYTVRKRAVSESPPLESLGFEMTPNYPVTEESPNFSSTERLKLPGKKTETKKDYVNVESEKENKNFKATSLESLRDDDEYYEEEWDRSKKPKKQKKSNRTRKSSRRDK